MSAMRLGVSLWFMLYLSIMDEVWNDSVVDSFHYKWSYSHKFNETVIHVKSNDGMGEYLVAQINGECTQEDSELIMRAYIAVYANGVCQMVNAPLEDRRDALAWNG